MKMQGLNRVLLWKLPCNVNIKLCIFCEEKQLGIEDISSEIGMPKINPDQRWAVMICKLKKDEERWKLVRIRSDDEVKHTCIDKEVSLSVVDYKIQDDKHWLFMVNEKINKEVDID